MKPMSCSQGTRWFYDGFSVWNVLNDCIKIGTMAREIVVDEEKCIVTYVLPTD